MWSAITNYRLKDFSFPSERRVLVIGDSYSGDIVNALDLFLESGVSSISTYQIPSKCGNLFVKHDITQYVAIEARGECTGVERYDNLRLQNLISQATDIWIISNWYPWVIEYLPESLSNIRALNSSASIKVFGLKNFEGIPYNELKYLRLDKKVSLKSPLREDFKIMNDRLKSILPRDNYVDTYEILCGLGETACNLFDGGTGLISFDGYHLTKRGVSLLSKKIQKNTDLINE